MSIPPWLFDELADAVVDNAELCACAEAWDGLLDGAVELHGKPYSRPRFDLALYRELRAQGVRPAAEYVQQRTDFWQPTIDAAGQRRRRT